MNRFRYGRDPLCLAAIGLYSLNRWVLKPRLSSAFLHNHFNDLLLIPAALPLVLWLHRRLGWRHHDAAPSFGEIILHLAVWTIICEVIGPAVSTRGTADWRDALAYTVGGLASWAWWRRHPATG